MADDDRKLNWRAINQGSISSILCLDNGRWGLEGVRRGSIWQLGNYAIWKFGCGKPIYKQLLWPYWLKNEQRLLVWGNKEWLCWGAGVIISFSVCPISKNICLEANSSLAIVAPGYYVLSKGYKNRIKLVFQTIFAGPIEHHNKHHFQSNLIKY